MHYSIEVVVFTEPSLYKGTAHITLTTSGQATYEALRNEACVSNPFSN